MKLPKLSSGQYTIANEGTQVLTKKQTDNLYDWAAYSPEKLMSARQFDMDRITEIWRNANIQEPVIERKVVNPAVNVHYDSMLTINGDVNDTNHFTKQVEKIADKQIDRLVNRIHDGIKYGR